MQATQSTHLDIVGNAHTCWERFRLTYGKNFRGALGCIQIANAEFNEIYLKRIVRPAK